MGTSLKKERITNRESAHDKAQDFIAAGVACYAFSLLDELGLVEQLLKDQGLSPDCFRSYPNPLAIRTAIQTLEYNNIVSFSKTGFRFTHFGESLALHRSSIGLIYNGYRRVLSDQIKIAQDQPSQNRNLIDEEAISKAASHMGGYFF